ncbi:hypothetical protein SAY86_028908 [Trapa natans]|uniref:ABC transporter domain-containing protein n=1 Tax=Trapa natans TaxID=22666 RepID=A0AAN7MDL8_TRANT|nr:hypothetical protein SAY86_028908 [Trapa natans]
MPDSGVSSNSRGAKTPYKLETKSLSYKISCKMEHSCFESPKRVPKFILKDANCKARPREITAIAGPSGAGKTTLLEILAGNEDPSGRRVSGQVLVNDRPMDSKRFQRLSGYVSQEDALFGSLTVEETLMYSALFRLRGGRREAAGRVKELIKELGLDHVADSRIGGVGWDRGISGGEKRRVSIGVELVHDPPVILLDEPTSGLDSASALHLVRLLKQMVIHQGKTIVLTIHQPGFRILELIDRVILLSDGIVLHNGPLSLLEQKFIVAGLRIPDHANILEYAIDVIESIDPQCHVDPTRHLLPQGNNGEKERASQSSEKSNTYLNSWSQEVLILGRRFFSNIFRTKQLFATRIIQALVAGFVLGTIFLNAGSTVGPLALQTRLGFFAFSLTFLLSSTTEGLPIFLQERRILMRETSRGAYRVSSYVVSNTLIFVPFLLMVGILYSVPVYWLVGLTRSAEGFLYYLLVVWMVLLMSNSFVACFSALVPNFIMGTSVISGLMGSFFLFSGYFISKEDIPIYWIWMHYVSLFKYPFECFLINEYGGIHGRRRCLEFREGECTLNGDGFLRQQGLEELDKWKNLGVMLGFILSYRVLCFLILWFRCYKIRS